VTVDLKHFEIMAGLSDPEKVAVEDQLELLELDPGETLFAEGHESDGLWLLETGSLGLHSERAGDLGRLAAGTVLGALSLVVPGARELSATAREESRVWQLSREAFRRIAIDEPHAAFRILEAVLADFAGAARGGLDALANSVSPERS
jgi:CRP-like cAMP-binding protein